MNVTLVTAPTELPLTMEELKSHLRVEDDEEDALISIINGAATDIAEEFTRRRFITQTWDLVLDYFPAFIRVPFPKLQSVTHVKYYDTQSALSTLDSSQYIVYTDDTPGRISTAQDVAWPSIASGRLDNVSVRFICGYGAATAVPKIIKQAIMLIAGDLFENRQNSNPNQMYNIPMTAEHLLWPHRDLRL